MLHSKHTELAWAAGFFDGEGNVRINDSHKVPSPVLKVSQVDQRVLDRFQEALGFGTVYRETRDTVAGKPVFTYRIQGHPLVQQAAAMLWSYLSPVKREQFKSVLEISRKPVKQWQKCAAIGHEIKVTKTYREDGSGTYRRCHTCQLEQYKKNNLKRRKKVSK